MVQYTRLSSCAKLRSMFNKLAPSLIILSVAGLSAADQGNPFKGLQIGVGAGLYFPTNSLMKEVFSTSIVTYNIGPMTTNRNGRKGFGFDFNGQGLQASGSRFFMLGLTYGYEWQSAEIDSDNRLYYARVGAGPAYLDYDINSPSNGVVSSGRGINALTAFEAGVVLSKRITLSATYTLLSKRDGLDFSGLRVQFNFAAFKL